MNLVLEIRLAPKQMGKLFLQSIFTLACSFFYSVSAPLDSAYPYFRISGLPGDSVENLDRYFLIPQVGLQIYRFNRHMLYFGYPQTPSQLLEFQVL